VYNAGVTDNPDHGVVIIGEPISPQRLTEIGNRSRGVEDDGRRKLICEIVDSLIR